MLVHILPFKSAYYLFLIPYMATKSTDSKNLMMLRVATNSNSAIDYIQKSLSEACVGYEIVETGDANLALQLGEIDAFVSELSDCKKQDSTVITALSQRRDTSFALLIATHQKAENQLFGLPEKAVVLCQNSIEGAQLLQYRTDIEVRITPIDLILKSVSENTCSAALIPNYFVNSSFLVHYEIIYFNIKEIIPAPGAGVWAWQCLASDLATRRVLKPLHNADVAECTNVERRAAALLANESGTQYAIFCDKNESHYYTLSLSEVLGNQVRTERLTNSTTFNLAEDLVEKFI
jgi:porphobilinogen deaminase